MTDRVRAVRGLKSLLKLCEESDGLLVHIATDDLAATLRETLDILVMMPLRDAARDLLRLRQKCPDMFEHVLQISDEDIRTLREIAEADEPNEDPYAQE